MGVGAGRRGADSLLHVGQSAPSSEPVSSLCSSGTCPARDAAAPTAQPYCRPEGCLRDWNPTGPGACLSPRFPEPPAQAGMFVLVEMVDTVRIPPWQFERKLNDSIAEELNKKLANKVLGRRGRAGGVAREGPHCLPACCGPGLGHSKALGQKLLLELGFRTRTWQSLSHKGVGGNQKEIRFEKGPC